MSDQEAKTDAFDPLGVLKGMRDASLESWAKMMTQTVNTDAYAGAAGAMINASLSASEPFRKLVETAMSQALANLRMPSRDDITRLAEQLTNIEMRLDDMEAKLDELAQARRRGDS